MLVTWGGLHMSAPCSLFSAQAVHVSPAVRFWTLKSPSFFHNNIIETRNLFLHLTAPFNSMRTLKFETRPTNAFSATVNQMFRLSSKLPTTAEHCFVVWIVLSDLITSRSAVDGSWDEPPNIWLTVAKNAVVGCALNFRVRMVFKGVVSLLHPYTLKAAKYEIQQPSTCRATLFRCKFWSMFRVFRLAWWTWSAKQTFDLPEREQICCGPSCEFDEKRATKPKFVAQSRPAPYFSQQLSSTCSKCFCCATSWLRMVKNNKHRPKLATKQCCATSWGFLYLVFRRL